MNLRKLILFFCLTVFMIPTALCQVNLTRGLVAYYPLNGNANDLSGNGLHGILKNGITATTDRYNQFNSAMSFDGIDDYIEVADNKLLRFRDSFSIAFLFNRTAQSSFAELIEKRDWNDGSKSSFDIGIINPGKIRTAIKTGSDCSDPLNGWVYPTESGLIQPNIWYCVAMTFFKGEVKFYLNGNLVGISNGTINTMDSCAGSSMRMGIHWQGDLLPFQGKMDEVRLYNRALDVTEVAALCDVVTPVFCSGTLGAPVVNIDFGTSPNPTGNLQTLIPGASTSLSFVPVSGNPAGPIPADGQYTISNNTPYNDAWFSGYQDHTPGDMNGNMAFFNASEQPGIFYSQTVNGLCESTTYEFAAWIANVLDPAKLSGVLPDLTFRIEKPDGTLLGSFNTGGIPQSSAFTWKQYGFLFTTGTGISTVVLKLINNNVGGTAQWGNDLAIDDITFRPCGGNLEASFSNSQIQSTTSQCSNSSINLYGTSSDTGPGITYRWQVRDDKSPNWTDIANSNALSINWPIPSSSIESKFWFRILSGNSTSINSSSCRIQSDSIVLTGFAIPAGTLEGSISCDETKPTFQFKSSAGVGPAFELIVREGSQPNTTVTINDATDFTGTYLINTSTDYQLISIKDQNSCINTTPGVLFYLTPSLCDIAAPVFCSGTLGAPVVNIDFGTFSNPTSNLQTLVPGASTSLSFVPVSGNPARPIPADGQYTISNNTPYNDAWFSGYKDHTPGDINGNLAFFNASEQPGLFYSQRVNGLCESTTYEFAAWIANVLNPAKLVGVLPDLTFRIEKPDGTLLGSFNTGGIAQNSVFTWKQYGFLFTTGTGISTVVLKLINNSVGGTGQWGNDLAIDDITFRPCGGHLEASFSNSQIQSTANQCSNSSINLYGSSSDIGPGITYRWQVRNDKSLSWTDIANSNTLSISWPIPSTSVESKFWFRILSGNSLSINTTSCRIQSDSIELTGFAIPAGALVGTLACGETKPTFQFKSTAGIGPTFELIIQEGSQPNTPVITKDVTDFAGNFPINASTDYQLISIKDQNNCINTSPGVVINLSPKQLPNATLSPIEGCVGDNAKIIFNTSDLNVPMGFTFTDGTSTYTVNGAVDGKQISLPIKLTSQTNIRLLTLYSEKQGSCIRNTGFTPATIAFTTSPSPLIKFPVLTPICEGSSPITLNMASETSGVIGSGTYSGKGIVANSFDPAVAGVGDHIVRYAFQANNGCAAFSEQSLTVVKLPVANAGQDIIACANTPIQLKGSGGLNYSWSPATGLSDPFIANPVVQISIPAEYVLTVTNADGCSDNDAIKIGVTSSNKSGFTMPNAFTPNGDGKNDCFGLQHWGQVSNVDFKIFNRWGQVIFKTTDPSKCWDGRINGKLVMTDQFIYTISAITGCGPVRLKGSVHLIR